MGLPDASRAVKEKLSPAQEMTSDDIDVLMGLRRVCVYFGHQVCSGQSSFIISDCNGHGMMER